MHMRYGRDIPYDDLIFEPAPPIAAQIGRNRVVATTSNLFAARYAVRRPWTGPLECHHHNRNLWNQNPDAPVRIALDPKRDRHRTLPLQMAVPGGVPELGIEPWQGVLMWESAVRRPVVGCIDEFG